MSLNVGKLLASVAISAAQASDIVGKAVFFVQMVETAAEAVGGLPGAEKLGAVKAALEGYIKAQFPDVSPQFAALWSEVSAIVTGLVTLYNATGFFRSLLAKKA